ncbi:MAG: glycerate kinase type-2 family protein [Actinomycetota bacterium]
MSLAHTMRSLAREIFLDALNKADIREAFDRHVQYDRGVLRVCEDLYDLKSYSRVLAVSIGKAAHRMAEILARQVGPTVQGIIADPTAHPYQLPGYRYFAGGHPQPNEESVRAAEAILKSLGALNEQSLAIFLISGGGSAAVEKPVDDEISLADLVSTYKALVLSGAPIAQINTVRKHLSATKGGGMARAAQPAQQVSIMVSDVPEYALDSLSSGPTMPDTTTTDDCYRIVNEHNLLPEFPASVRELFERHALEETPKPNDPAFARSRWWKILSNETAEKAAAAEATRHGFAAEIDHTCDDWDHAKAADYLLNRLRELKHGVSQACIVSGGEVTVKVAGNAGMGGRNQHFALYCAQKIAGENIVVLSAGTDGIDGTSPAAGAVADGTTVQRALAAGLDPAGHLGGFNAFPLFQKLGDLVETGPTGNNVRDVRILMAF